MAFLGRLSLALALAAGLALAARADDSAAEKALAATLAEVDPERPSAPLARYVVAGGKERAEAILAAVEKDGAPYWRLLRAVAVFRDRAGLEVVAKRIVGKTDARDPVPVDLVFALQENTSPLVVGPLAAALEKGSPVVKLVAAGQLAHVRAPETVDALIAAWAREAKGPAELARRVRESLGVVTGVTFDSPEAADRWWREKRVLGLDAGVETPRGRVWRLLALDPADRVVVLSGDRSTLRGDPCRDHDRNHLERALERRKLPHVVARKHVFDADPARFLARARALMINCNPVVPHCTCKKCVPAPPVKPPGPAPAPDRRGLACGDECKTHLATSHELSAKTLGAIKKWVEEGGSLYTEDWGLTEVIDPLWPEKVGFARNGTFWNDAPRPYALRTFDAGGQALATFPAPLEPGRGAGAHPLLAGAWQVAVDEDPRGAHAPALPPRKVELDDETPAIRIADWKNVATLLESPAAPNGQPLVVTFRPGKTTRLGDAAAPLEWVLTTSGRVVHSALHYGRGDLDETDALENIVLDFLHEAKRRHEAGAAVKKP